MGVLVFPAAILALTFMLYPIADTIRLSFTNWTGIGPANYVGWANFAALFNDDQMTRAILNNLLFAVVVTIGTMALGTTFAMAIYRRVRFWAAYRFIFFFPVIMPGVVVSILWVNALDPNFGSVNKLLGLINPNWVHGFLADPATAMLAICGVAIWASSGFTMIVILAGLQNIPVEIQEAATVDGVSTFQRAFRISIPMIKDVLATVTLLQIIFSFKVFDIVQAMTQGGPGDATQVLGTLIYKNGFQFSNFGYASAIALVMTIVIVLISLVYLYFIKPQRIERHG